MTDLSAQSMPGPEMAASSGALAVPPARPESQPQPEAPAGHLEVGDLVEQHWTDPRGEQSRIGRVVAFYPGVDGGPDRVRVEWLSISGPMAVGDVEPVGEL